MELPEPITIIELIAPEFINDPRLSLMLTLADQILSPNLCGNKRPIMVAYYAAHLLALGGRNQKYGTSGDVVSITEGKLSKTYANSKNTYSSLGLTSYGQTFRDMLRGCVLTPMTRVTNIPIVGDGCGCY